MSTLPAKTHDAGIVIPAEAKVIHPPDLGEQHGGRADANNIQVLERIIQGDRLKRAIGACR